MTFSIDNSGLWPQAVSKIGGLALGGEACAAAREKEAAASRKAKKRRVHIRNIVFMKRLLYRDFDSFPLILTKYADKVNSLEIFPFRE
jgi:hypothetical protein